MYDVEKLFWLSHDLIEENNKKYLVCKLCGSKMLIKSDAKLERIISRTGLNSPWCENDCCFNFMSSIHNYKNENGDFEGLSTNFMRFTHVNYSTGVPFYHFTCPNCGLEDLMSFEEVIEHMLTHLEV